MVYLEAAIQEFSLKYSFNFRYSWGISVGGSFPIRLQVGCLPSRWKWAPSWVFLKYFAYFVIYCVNGCFWGIALSDCFIILSKFFILMLHGSKAFWRALFVDGYLVLHRININIWYCISCFLNINSVLAI